MDAHARMSIDGGTAVVDVSGEIDLSTGDLLASVLLDACAAGLDIVIDLSEVEFMDAVGLRLIERAQRTVQLSGRTLRIVHPRAPVRRLFIAARRDDLLTV